MATSKQTARREAEAAQTRSVIEQNLDRLTELAASNVSDDMWRALFDIAAGETFEFLTTPERLKIARNALPVRFVIAEHAFTTLGEAWNVSLLVEGKVRKFTFPHNDFREVFFTGANKLVELRGGEALPPMTIRLISTSKGPGWDLVPISVAQETLPKQQALIEEYEASQRERYAEVTQDALAPA